MTLKRLGRVGASLRFALGTLLVLFIPAVGEAQQATIRRLKQAAEKKQEKK